MSIKRVQTNFKAFVLKQKIFQSFFSLRRFQLIEDIVDMPICLIHFLMDHLIKSSIQQILHVKKIKNKPDKIPQSDYKSLRRDINPVCQEQQLISKQIQFSWLLIQMAYYNSYCDFTARNCGSGCCNINGNCATSPTSCTYRYSDFYSNTDKYYYNGTVSALCGSAATRCTSGCCTSSGSCSTSSSNCAYRYADFYTNSSKYYFTSNSNTSTSTSSPNLGVIIGPVVGGVLFILIVIGSIIKYKRKQASLQQIQGMRENLNANGGGTTILMTNNTPQPVYGMSQPIAPYSQPIPINQPYAPYLQPMPISQPFTPAFQPMGQLNQPLNSQPMNQVSYGLGMQAQQGPIIY